MTCSVDMGGNANQLVACRKMFGNRFALTCLRLILHVVQSPVGLEF